jgi:hypothetical protein
MDRLTQEMTRRVGRTEKVACPGDDRYYAFPDPVNEVRGSRMPKGVITAVALIAPVQTRES